MTTPERVRRRALALLPAVALLAVGVPASDAVASTSSSNATKSLFVVQSPAIDEDSALVRRSGLFVTTNDSGDTGRLFVLGRSGRTVGVVHWSKHPFDCEALAPAAPGYVWVGDIGDNRRRRATISVSRVPISRGDHTVRVAKYRLVYPDGPANAESLLRDPTTGRLYLATKDVNGGTLYGLPLHLRRHHANALVPVAPVLAEATDAAFLPGGDFLVVRNYVGAELYAWPSMTSLGTFPLPGQRQGEGIAAASGGRLFLSSEGVDQPILRTLLPDVLRQIVVAPRAAAG